MGGRNDSERIRGELGVNGPLARKEIGVVSEPVAPICFCGPRWFVVYTLARCEDRARLGLEAKGFECFLPTLIRELRHARRAVIAKRPLFPRYLFCRFDI